jgi:hypothetical protein
LVKDSINRQQIQYFEIQLTAIMSHSPNYFYTHDKELVNEIQEENPEADVKEVRKILKEQWEVLDEDEKEPWEEMSLKSQKKSPKKSVEKSPKKSAVSAKETSPKKSPKVKGQYNKRAKTAWIHFFTDDDIRSSHTEKGKHLMKVLSEKWKGMSDDEKQPWVDKHETQKEELAENPILKIRKSPSPRKSTKRETQLLEEVKQLKEQMKILIEWKEAQEKKSVEKDDSDVEDDSDEDEEEVEGNEKDDSDVEDDEEEVEVEEKDSDEDSDEEDDSDEEE